MAWHEKVKRAATNLMLAHRASHLDRLQQEGALVRRLIRKRQNGTLGQATTEPEDAEGADMGVRIGDEMHYHYPAGAPAATGSSWSGLLKAAGVIAGLLGSAGLGLGLAVLSRPAEPAPQIAPPTGDGLQYDLRLSPQPPQPQG